MLANLLLSCTIHTSSHKGMHKQMHALESICMIYSVDEMPELILPFCLDSSRWNNTIQGGRVGR